MTFTAQIQTPIGWITIETNQTAITALQITREPIKNELIDERSSTELINHCITQLNEYFRGERQIFDLPLANHGTPFQTHVWNTLLTIPYGNTISYKELAQQVGNSKASRAVGNANGKNNIAIIVPCHRVIQSDGHIGGYAYGTEIKQQLLDLELRNKKGIQPY